MYFGTECYGPQASAITKRLLPPGTTVRLTPEPATDSIDSYGRLLRYVFRARDGLNINVYLARIGASADPCALEPTRWAGQPPEPFGFPEVATG